ncbi:MAG TPA: crotonase/enoyl-CoA hydratase family protein [Pseudomonadales bacterium]|nr:crotonase/enoyl-CoA hydratase family protein [Pseudomonadales bacterium]
MNALVKYELNEGVATITLDDGKANALSADMLAQINAALDQAQADQAVVLLAGRTGYFTGGFDLKTLMSGTIAGPDLLQAGFELAHRIMGFAKPVVIACSGHALAMGSFLLLAADVRIGAAGAFKIGANEVAIGMPMPNFPAQLCRAKLAPTYLTRAVLTAEIFNPEGAVNAGFLDRVVPAEELMAEAQKTAAALTRLNPMAFGMTRQVLNSQLLAKFAEAIKTDVNMFKGQLGLA